MESKTWWLIGGVALGWWVARNVSIAIGPMQGTVQTRPTPIAEQIGNAIGTQIAKWSGAPAPGVDQPALPSGNVVVYQGDEVYKYNAPTVF